MTLDEPIDPQTDPGISVTSSGTSAVASWWSRRCWTASPWDSPASPSAVCPWIRHWSHSSPARPRRSYPKIREAGRFGINILSLSQTELCRQMARSGTDKWNGVEWKVSEGGSPVLASSHAFLDCVFETEYEAGDHFIVLGRVTALSAEPETSPLLLHRGAYSQLIS